MRDHPCCGKAALVSTSSASEQKRPNPVFKKIPRRLPLVLPGVVCQHLLERIGAVGGAHHDAQLQALLLFAAFFIVQRLLKCHLRVDEFALRRRQHWHVCTAASPEKPRLQGLLICLFSCNAAHGVGWGRISGSGWGAEVADDVEVKLSQE